MPSQNYSDRDADIDLIGLFRAIWRRKFTVAGVSLGMAAAGFVVATSISPKYQAETRIVIESRVPEFSQGADKSPGTSSDPVYDEAGVLSQVQILQSVDLIKAVSRKLKLNDVAELDPSSHPSMLTDVMVLLGLAANPLDTPPEERVVQEFTKRLQVYQVEKSRVIAIQFSSKDPQLSAKVPNTMAEIYMTLQSGAKLGDNEDATKWLEPEIANLREKVRKAEEKVAEYRANADLQKTGEQTTFVGQQLNDISQELARVRGDRASAEAKAEAVRAVIKSGGNAETLGDVVASPMIQRLKENQATIESQLADLSTTHLPGHPRIKAVRAQLADVRQQIQSETRKILASLESDAATSRMRENQLVGQLNALKADNARAGEQEVGLKALEREAASQRQLLETYLARYREAASRQNSKSTPADARVVSGALVPTLPYFPKVVPITVIAGVAGFIFSAVSIMLSELLSGRAMRPLVPVRRRNEDEDWTGFTPTPTTIKAKDPVQPTKAATVRAVAEKSVAETKAQPVSEMSADMLVPYDDLAVNLPAKPHPDHERARTVAAEALAGIRPAAAIEQDTEVPPADAMEAAARDFIDDEFSIASVSRYLIDRAVPLAACVSPVDNGAAASVILVRTLAENGGRVLLVDMTGTGLPTRLMAESNGLPGITNLLAGETAFGETIHADRLSDAHIIPRGTANPDQAMKSFGRLSMIFDALTNAYDIVVVECGPANAQAVRNLMSRHQAEIVMSVGKAGREDIEAAVNQFIEAGYEDIVLMMGPDDAGLTRSSRRTA